MAPTILTIRSLLMTLSGNPFPLSPYASCSPQLNASSIGMNRGQDTRGVQPSGVVWLEPPG